MPKLNINNQEYNFDADLEMPLLWVLRDILKLKGTKFGCGMGLCGSCTVIVDDQAIRSCITPINTIENKKIRTIEGLSTDGSQIIQRAWKEFNVPQCGYCQAGQIMSATNLIEENDKLSEQEINSFMSGNICRCGTYPRIKKAINWALENKGKVK